MYTMLSSSFCRCFIQSCNFELGTTSTWSQTKSWSIPLMWITPMLSPCSSNDMVSMHLGCMQLSGLQTTKSFAHLYNARCFSSIAFNLPGFHFPHIFPHLSDECLNTLQSCIITSIASRRSHHEPITTSTAYPLVRSSFIQAAWCMTTMLALAASHSLYYVFLHFYNIDHVLHALPGCAVLPVPLFLLQLLHPFLWLLL